MPSGRQQLKAKTQHYLPCVYLKQFSADGLNATRKSKVWRLDPTICVEVPVDSQCSDNYFYTKADSALAEEQFHELEQQYGLIARKIRQGQTRTPEEDYRLILMMFDIHLRNRMYTNQTGNENFEAYKIRWSAFRSEILLPGAVSNPTDAEVLDHLKNSWRVQLLQVNEQFELATSDNPSLWFSIDNSSSLHFVVLPITPACCAVAFDVRCIRVHENKLSCRDTFNLNRHQICHSQGALYSSKKPTPEEKEMIIGEWHKREKPGGSTTDKKWTVNLLRWRGRDHLSFLVEPGH